MKALLVKHVYYESVLDFVHGNGQVIVKLVFPNLNGLAIGVAGERIEAYEGFVLDDHCFVLGEVEVEMRVIREAQAYVKARKQLEAVKEEVKKLTTVT